MVLIARAMTSNPAMLILDEPESNLDFKNQLTVLNCIQELSRQRGWFMNSGESIPDVGAIAWPVTLSGEHYAISVGGPIYRIEPEQESYARILRAACTGLEQQA